MKRFLGIFLVFAGVAAVAGPLQQPQAPPVSNTASQSAIAATTGETSQQATSRDGTRNEPSEDIVLKRTHVILGIVATAIVLILYWWKGMHWAAFTPLESAAGSERLRILIEGELKKNPKILMELIHEKLNNPTGQQTIAKYAVAHWQTEDGSAEMLKLMLRLLKSDEAKADMTELVARFAAVRDEAKDRVGEAIQAVLNALGEASARVATPTSQVKQGEIGGEWAEEPAEHALDGEALMAQIARFARRHQKKGT